MLDNINRRFYGIIIFVLWCLNGVLAQGAFSGLIQPIEVVEEFGCYDTEIRLTCGDLDSKIGILSATFTPNCTGYDDECYAFNGIRFRNYKSRKLNLRQQETKAGYRFLETLRMTPDEEMTPAYVEELPYSTAETKILVDPKEKKMSLKQSLEMLLVKYLHRNSPDHDEDYKSIRSRRNLLNASTSAFSFYDDNEVNEPTTPDMFDDSVDYVTDYSDNSVKPLKSNRVIIGEKNITVSENKEWMYKENKLRKNRLYLGERKKCVSRRRRIAQLDRFELEKSLLPEKSEELNIRKVLNYRCSGKNHCSFVFGLDHPFSPLWNSGTVVIKYMCMDDFRINKFCNEQLVIGNEVEIESLPTTEPPNFLIRHGEPIAEARLQADQSFHSFTNVKIIKSEKTDEELKLEMENAKRRKQRIYSQDFKILKILPKSVDDFNAIEQIGDEFFFKKDEVAGQQNKVSTVSSPTTYQTQHALTTNDNSINNPQELDVIIENKSEEDIEHNYITETTDPIFEYTVQESNMPFNDNKILSGELESQQKHVTMEYETNLPARNTEKLDVESATKIFDAGSKTTTTPLWSFGSIQTNTMKEDVIDVEINSDSDNSNKKNSNYYDYASTKSLEDNIDYADKHDSKTNLEHDKSVIKLDNIKSDEINDSYEDEDDYDNFNLEKRKNYKSIQRTALHDPLVHGFIMSPGYPKFYIGESLCYWNITSPAEQKIRITVLDINLRTDFNCQDSIHIIDVGFNRIIFNSCSESARPIEIVSESNQVEIIFNTTSKMAFAKRGILLHYTALGCLTPTAPFHAYLISRSETSAKYLCVKNFVFPDSGILTRELRCTEKHTWDKTLPDCIAQTAIEGSGLVQHLEHKSLKSVRRQSNAKMPEDHVLYDVIIPSTVIAGLFIVNTIVFVIIMHFRKKRNERLDFEKSELAEL